jgi:tetratricopeptide (TPR) repeat protein
MLKHLILLTLLIDSVAAARLTLDERRRKILSIVDEELVEVSRLAKQQDYRSPETLLRVAELNLEKGRLYREAENEQYLAIPPEERARLNKRDYFSQSSRFFDAANDAALAVVKKFPKYASIGEVYYVLAYNYKELGDAERARKYFQLAVGSVRDPKILGKSRQALADIYFNDKKYADAVPLYEATLKAHDDKWWTKDAFNLAWSYYRTKNYDRAIALMREVHRKSGGKYVDLRSQVERDIGIFYVDANRINDAIQFFEATGLSYTDQFIKIATTITAQGRFDQAEKLLGKVKGIEKDRARRVEILLAELSLFDKFSKTAAHLATARELVALHQKAPLEKAQFEKLSFQVNKNAAELQKATASDMYDSVPKVKQQKARESIAYFELAGQLNPGQKAEKLFFQGETAYAAGDFGKAITLYVVAFDGARADGNKKLLSQSLEGMLAALGQPGLPKATAERSYVPVYSRYVAVDARSDRARAIFVKLFNAQFDGGDVADAEKTLGAFAKSFPDDYKTQEAMLAKVMEHYRTKRDYGPVKGYVARINAGEFKVSAKYADALRSLMTKIQIEGVQQSLERGDKGVALAGYHQIYVSGESTPKAKVNAAYNLAALYFELGDTAQSYTWATTALRDMEAADAAKFADSYLSIAAGLFLRQQFAPSADLSHRLVAKLCREPGANKAVAYKNAVFIALADDDIPKALEVRETGRSCGLPPATVAEVSFELLKNLAKAEQWDTYERILRELEGNPKNAPLLIRPYEDLRRELANIGEADEARAIAQKQDRFYQEARAKKLDIPVDALDLVAERIVAGVAEQKKRLDQIPLAFPQAVFEGAVKSKLQLLDQMASEVNQLQKVGSGKGIVEGYRYIIAAYEEFAESLKAFTPPGMSPEVVESFRKAMADVHGPILQNARKQRAEVRKLIVDNKILSFSNFSVLSSEKDKDKRYFTQKEAVLMDRGGRR